LFGIMAEQNAANADTLLSRIEVAAGEITPKDANAPLIREILSAVNGLRSLLGAVRGH
jgi:hypothetical protein